MPAELLLNILARDKFYSRAANTNAAVGRRADARFYSFVIMTINVRGRRLDFSLRPRDDNIIFIHGVQQR